MSFQELLSEYQDFDFDHFFAGVTDADVSVAGMLDPHRVLVDEADRLENIPQIKALLAAGFEGPYSFEPFAPEVHDLADSEAVSYVRCCRLIAEPGSEILSYDEAGWAKRLNYHDRDPEEALAAAADAALVTRDSVRTAEMLSASSTLETALPLVYHSGALLHSLPQSNAVRPASSASTARME